MNISINNCNNIKEANISIEKDSLNIKYGMNGTGKSTIADAIISQKDLTHLKTFDSEEEPKFNSTEPITNPVVFNSKFINSFTFNGTEVIDDAFEVFIKSEKYDEKRESINKLLKELNDDVFKDSKVDLLLETFRTISTKLQLNTNNTVKLTPSFKSILNKENIFTIPESLKKYSEFITDKDNNISWTEWKHKGFEYDNKDKCPFCAEKLQPSYAEEKTEFQTNYTKANIKNLSEVLSNIEIIKEYMKEEKYMEVVSSIKENIEKEAINMIFEKFLSEMNYLNVKLINIYNFDSYHIDNKDIGKLSEIVEELRICLKGIDYFNSELITEIINDINNKIDSVLSKIEDLKREMGTLNGFIVATIKESEKDINNFLNTAGITYKFELKVTDDGKSKTMLKYTGEREIDVENIEQHLSWGEKNSFALVLFMYYAISQKTDLIILDDPISSFDSNKKYAIINRLFEKRADKKSLYGRTVLMLTHDFEPIIDFICNQKPNSGHAVANYIKNNNNIISEKKIENRIDILSMIEITEKYSKDININIVSRICFLRKYIELTKTINQKQEEQYAYDILSSLYHVKSKPDKQVTRDSYVLLTDEEIEKGNAYIKKYIEDFDYNKILTEKMKKEVIIAEYESESNNYIKSQLFREYLEVTGSRSELEDNLLKYIDEIYHVENDYIFSLDLIKFDTIPGYIIKKMDEYMKSEIE